jgi:hypothetical protein
MDGSISFVKSVGIKTIKKLRMKNNDALKYALRYAQLESELRHGGYQGDLMHEQIMDVLVDEIIEIIGDDKEKLKSALMNISILGRVQGEQNLTNSMKDWALATVTSIFHHGNFKVETANERVLLNMLKVLGYWPTTEDQIIKRSMPEHLFKKLNVDI